MTPEERANPKIIDGSRRRRIARGSGTTVQAVTQLVKQFGQMQKVMKQVASGQDAVAAAAGRRSLTSPGSMSVRVRLTRVGSKKNPIWRVVVADQRSPRDGRVIETIGHYNPQTEPSTIVIDEERFQHWLARGAQPTNTVKQLVRAQAKGTAVRQRSEPSRARAEPEPTLRGVVEELLEYLARSLVDQPGRGERRVVRGGRRHARARAARRRRRRRQGDRPRRPHGRRAAHGRCKAAAVRDGQRVLVDVVD